MATDNSLISVKLLIAAIILTLLIGIGSGYALGNAEGANHDHSEHDNSSAFNKKDDHGHDDEHPVSSRDDHDMFMVAADNAPTISLEVSKDARSGYNLHLETENFTFAPMNVNGNDTAGEGHAHLYVDSLKVARVYGSDYHYDGEIDKKSEFRVVLNSNSHAEYSTPNGVIESITTVEE